MFRTRLEYLSQWRVTFVDAPSGKTRPWSCAAGTRRLTAVAKSSSEARRLSIERDLERRVTLNGTQETFMFWMSADCRCTSTTPTPSGFLSKPVISDSERCVLRRIRKQLPWLRADVKLRYVGATLWNVPDGYRHDEGETMTVWLLRLTAMALIWPYDLIFLSRNLTFRLFCILE